MPEGSDKVALMIAVSTGQRSDELTPISVVEGGICIWIVGGTMSGVGVAVGGTGVEVGVGVRVSVDVAVGVRVDVEVGGGAGDATTAGA